MNYETNKEPEEIKVDENELPFCCGVNVLGEAEGDIALLAEAINDGDFENDSSYLIYTLTDSQKAEAAQLSKAGFTTLAVFKNRKSANIVTIYGKNLSPVVPAKPRSRR